MDQTVDTSNAMSELEQTSSLLNHNVSFNSSMEMTLANTSPVAKTNGNSSSSLPNLSFSLSETERNKLILCQMLPADNITNNSQEEESELEESERVISIEDTLDDQSAGNSTKQPDQSDTVTPAIAYFQQALIELGRRCWSSSAEAQHYTKGCYWSPDGTCLLLPVHLDGMHVMELPLDLYNADCVTMERSLSQLQSAVHVPEGGTVYDCVWYPLMNSQQPDTCLWLATRQHEPIHMWDAFDGKLRCSYAGYDAVDEVVAAISLAFSQDGQKIYAGYKRCIKIFDTNRPGRSYDEYAVKFAVSCIAQTSEHPQTVTCGNWRGYIQQYDLRCAPKVGPLFTLGGHTGGITQLRYVNDAGTGGGGGGNWQLFSGARKCPKLLQWDMRNYKQPLREFQRLVNTNQRIQFDLSPQQHSWLASGDTMGVLNLWHLEKEANTKALQLPLHGDCCNGISFHPTLPILASSSGQYHFIQGENSTDVNGTTILDSTEDQQQMELEQPSVVDYENAVLLLWCGDGKDSLHC
ncbi:GH10930 [Drosophila grimshawi]|uniref:GH10930 n=1 Tax=Drosophila grimshawi TaxID=7222 RepID=B4JAZ5_DROGR|nr:GH10930 [Drosophila grimshawi]